MSGFSEDFLKRVASEYGSDPEIDARVAVKCGVIREQIDGKGFSYWRKDSDAPRGWAMMICGPPTPDPVTSIAGLLSVPRYTDSLDDCLHLYNSRRASGDFFNLQSVIGGWQAKIGNGEWCFGASAPRAVLVAILEAKDTL